MKPAMIATKSSYSWVPFTSIQFNAWYIYIVHFYIPNSMEFLHKKVFNHPSSIFGSKQWLLTSPFHFAWEEQLSRFEVQPRRQGVSWTIWHQTSFYVFLTGCGVTCWKERCFNMSIMSTVQTDHTDIHNKSDTLLVDDSEKESSSPVRSEGQLFRWSAFPKFFSSAQR